MRAGVLDAISAIAFPASCILCLEALARPLGGPLCARCLSSLARVRPPYCGRCGLGYEPSVAAGVCGPCRTTRRFFRRARASLVYDDAVRRCLHALKFGDRRRLASVFGCLAGERWVLSGELSGAAVIPVPLSRRRRRERGFNQAELIGRAVARAARLPLAIRLLRKSRDRPPQAGLSARDRHSDWTGVYRARLPSHLRGKDLILVDDVLTTGATVSAAASVLLSAGAKAVDVLTVARVQ